MESYSIAHAALPALGIDLNGGCALVVSYITGDTGRMIGAVCGALMYLTRSRERSAWRRAIRFAISFLGGDFLAQGVLLNWPRVEPWLASFVCSTALVSATTLVLDWAERHLAPLLDRFYEWLVKRFLR